MANNSGGGCSSYLIAGVLFLLVLGGLGSCMGDSSSDDYSNTLKSGYSKYLTGEKMNRQEYNAVKSYNNWLDKQGEKSYSDWDD